MRRDRVIRHGGGTRGMGRGDADGDGRSKSHEEARLRSERESEVVLAADSSSMPRRGPALVHRSAPGPGAHLTTYRRPSERPRFGSRERPLGR
jgi:hypothetical protein